jgi:hypothetical protein
MRVQMQLAHHLDDVRAKSASEAETDQADRLRYSDAKVTRRVYRRLPKTAHPASLPTKK